MARYVNIRPWEIELLTVQQLVDMVAYVDQLIAAEQGGEGA